MLRKYDLKAENNIRARRVHTQFQLFRRILITFIVVITIGALLWTFNDPRIWHYGSGLLASAGIASLILATAAKSTAANFLAGLQIAFTEPIRIDDVVVIQGEWGRIEEINSAYVVVRIWDLRRLIVPLYVLHRKLISRTGPASHPTSSEPPFSTSITPSRSKTSGSSSAASPSPRRCGTRRSAASR